MRSLSKTTVPVLIPVAVTPPGPYRSLPAPLPHWKTTPAPGTDGAGERADRRWLKGYSSSSNPMEGPLGGLARMAKNKPFALAFYVLIATLLMLMTLLSTN